MQNFFWSVYIFIRLEYFELQNKRSMFLLFTVCKTEMHDGIQVMCKKTLKFWHIKN